MQRQSNYKHKLPLLILIRDEVVRKACSSPCMGQCLESMRKGVTCDVVNWQKIVNVSARVTCDLQTVPNHEPIFVSYRYCTLFRLSTLIPTKVELTPRSHCNR